MKIDRSKQTRLSAEWAAYGDALGFMTELADTDRIQYRIGAEQVSDTLTWKRKIGGYNGLNMELPAGSYSDDTQLRLSTSRAIRADGTFDVAAFAKVELPAWVNYALGAGAGSKEAASNLARTSATWYSNFFNSKRATYIHGGGNGAAMRIQPHVWSARDLSKVDAILLDVIRNSVCTHGHPRGILGACLHALTLVFPLRQGRPARLFEIKGMIEDLQSVPKLVKKDGDLRLLWLSAWEEASGLSFEKAVAQVIGEIIEDIEILDAFGGEKLSEVYTDAVEALGALESSSRGSGTKTALLAAFVASITEVSDPKKSLLTVINTLGSDTDSIASMAGAIIGACTNENCEGALQDRDYIHSEAHRLAMVADGSEASSFRYPDLRSWKPARAAVDAIGVLEGSLCMNGLGLLELVDSSSMKELGGDMMGWCRLSFGQTVLARIRLNPHVISPARAGIGVQHQSVVGQISTLPPSRLQDVFKQNGSKVRSEKPEAALSLAGLSLNEILQKVMSAGFPPELIGKALLQQVETGGKEFVERGIALTANILTAYEARSKRRQS